MRKTSTRTPSATIGPYSGRRFDRFDAGRLTVLVLSPDERDGDDAEFTVASPAFTGNSADLGETGDEFMMFRFIDGVERDGYGAGNVSGGWFDSPPCGW
jgi:hypothetical protein